MIEFSVISEFPFFFFFGLGFVLWVRRVKGFNSTITGQVLVIITRSSITTDRPNCESGFIHTHTSRQRYITITITIHVIYDNHRHTSVRALTPYNRTNTLVFIRHRNCTISLFSKYSQPVESKMDLSNLRTSLREEEVSGQRRTAHLRAAEDELNAFFRSSALGLTTLYRQGVAATKSSYEKGYAHALAHVLELWDKDRDWLKGYLQRRIEAIEAADAEDDGEEVQMDQRPQQQQHQHRAETSFPRSPTQVTSGSQEVTSDSPRQNNKRSRSGFNDGSTPSHREQDDLTSDRRSFHRIPHSSASPRFPSAANFASGSFSFSTPLAYPSSSITGAAATCAASASKVRSPRSTSDAAVIKTSNPATSRRRLQKLKGLRAGRGDRIVEIEKAQDEQDEILIDGIAGEDADAWTDEEEGQDENVTCAGKRGGAGGRGKKAIVWAERAAASNASNSAHAPQAAEGKVLERLDRRKRRRTRQPEDIAMRDEGESSAEVSREEERNEYRYHS